MVKKSIKTVLKPILRKYDAHYQRVVKPARARAKAKVGKHKATKVKTVKKKTSKRRNGAF